ncbi:MAG: hypothetical protein NZ903_00330 [Candidatus Micrarchaeota archaeon]|nr:hypothetical protein [Candidatus Micrarchaeota archaeon]
MPEQEKKKKDYSIEVMGAVVFLLLLALLCYFKIICPPPSCPRDLQPCNHCPGNCCLPDGSCPCPKGSVPCDVYCPSTINCPSGCCNVDTCACVATPFCPPNTMWSETRGCCLFLKGPNAGKCAQLCSSDQKRVACDLKGVDACDQNGCCPLGSLGWDSNKLCCVDEEERCIVQCAVDENRFGCPEPGQGGCDENGCCPHGTYWSAGSVCCLTEQGFCYDEQCANVVCPSGKICVNGRCVDENEDLCFGVVCPEGEVCNPATGRCTKDSCKDVNCPQGYICTNGVCVEDKCANVLCQTGEKCVDGKCVSICDTISCLPGSVCDPKTGECIDARCSSNEQCKRCDLILGVCGGIKGSKRCVSDEDCQDVVCDYLGICGRDSFSDKDLIDCQYKGTVGDCPSDVICNSGCAQEIKCVDKRLPSGLCKGVGDRCSSSSECCCGYNCQIINGEGICCPGGMWRCGFQFD